MKKKFYTVGTLCYTRNYKCGAGLVAAIVGGTLAATGSVAAAGINSSSQANINAENEELTRDSWHMQERWMNEQMDFNLVEAEKAREWQSEEAALQRDFSEQQALLQRQFESEEAAKARDWNAVDAQIQRAKDAGVNPSFYINNGFPTSNVSAGGAAASAPSVPATSPAGAVGSPTAGVIPKQAPNLSALSHLGDIADTMSDVALKESMTEKNKEDTKSVATFNQFQGELLKSNIKVNKASAKKMYGDYCLAMNQIEVAKETVKNLQASTVFMDAKTTSQDIENIYKSHFMAGTINQLEQKANLDKATATALMYKLPLELGLIKSQQALNYMSSQYFKSASDLNYEEVKKVESITSLFTTQNAQQEFNLLLDLIYGPRERAAGVKQMEYNSDDTIMLLRTISDCLNTIFNGVQAGAQVHVAKKIGDNVKLKEQKPNPIGGFGVTR